MDGRLGDALHGARLGAVDLGRVGGESGDTLPTQWRHEMDSMARALIAAILAARQGSQAAADTACKLADELAAEIVLVGRESRLATMALGGMVGGAL